MRRQAKRVSWEKFLSGINSYTQETKVWNGLRTLKGQSSHLLPLVNKAENRLEDQANALGEHFEHVYSSMNYTPSFLKHTEQLERMTLDSKCRQIEPYNGPFTIAELRA